MTTIIDALVLTLGLDASGLKKGASEVDTALKKTKEAGVKQMTAVETSGNLAADAIGMIARKALALFAIFTAGKGIKEFIGDVTASDNAMGRLSSRLGVGSDTLSEYGQAIDRMGGNGKAAQASFQSLTSSLIDLQQTGQSGITEWYYRLASAAGVTFDRNKKVEDQFLDISAALAKIKAQNPALANWYGQKLGLDQDTIDFLSKGPKFVQGELAKGKKWAPTPEEIKRTDEFLDKWQSLLNISTSFGRHLLSDIEPGIAHVAEKFNKWLDDNKDTINKYIVIPFRLVGAAIETAIDLGKALLSVFEYIGNIPWVKALVNMIGSGLSAAGGWIDRQIESLPEGNPVRRGYERFKKAATPDSDAPGGGGDGGGGAARHGGTAVPPPGEAGQYRPVYKLGEKDLSDSVVNKIAGEAIPSNPASVDAVINNMFNRLGTKTYGPSGNLEEVALAEGQYAAAADRKATPEHAKMIRERIRAIASGAIPDITHGSNEYRAGWYMGPWGRKHSNAPVIGGNRFAHNPAGGLGPYAPYDKPAAAPTAAPAAAGSSGPYDKPMAAAAPTAAPAAAGSSGPYDKPMAAAAPTAAPAAAGSSVVDRVIDFIDWVKAHQPKAAAAHVSALTPIPSGGLAGLNAARANVSQSTTTNTSSHEVNVNGPITVHTQATDARGVASGLSDAMKRATYAAQANTGLA